MKPWETLGTAQAPDGTTFTLARRDTEYVILSNGQLLMTNRMHASEELIASVACEAIRDRPRPRVLIGGLGMGYTLRTALDHLPADADVVVGEIMPAVVEWNEGPLGHLAGHPLQDSRVTIDLRDIAETLRTNRAGFDAIMLDVDNGADAIAVTSNRGLYGPRGIRALHDALRPQGVLTVWSEGEDKPFGRHLRAAGFVVEMRRTRARDRAKGPFHTIFVARRS